MRAFAGVLSWQEGKCGHQSQRCDATVLARSQRNSAGTEKRCRVGEGPIDANLQVQMASGDDPRGADAGNGCPPADQVARGHPEGSALKMPVDGFDSAAMIDDHPLPIGTGAPNKGDSST